MILYNMNSRENGKTKVINMENKEKYNQYFTNQEIAEFMASLITIKEDEKNFNILDPGAGKGILGIKAVNYIVQNSDVDNISLTAYEIDSELSSTLKCNYEALRKYLVSIGVEFKYCIITENFLYTKSKGMRNNFDLVIMNPPYEKIIKNSKEYNAMEEQGYSKTNLYSSFSEKSLDFLKEGGQLITIIPRSFANGVYFASFRTRFFSISNLTNIHLFETRKLFTDVLQENIILKSEKKEANKDNNIMISYSVNNENLKNPHHIIVKNHEIIDIKKKYQLRIVKNTQDFDVMKSIHSLPYKLEDLMLEVSTGPIVDFREGRELKRKTLELFTVPYLFPEHFNLKNKTITWPKYPVNKANYIIIDDSIKNKLRENGNYVLVKRFSSKEEKRRINAAIWLGDLSEDKLVGFDNKVNYFHSNKKGLELDLSKGLGLYLNSTIVDEYFRQISGNTQVNVSDLRNLKYPSKDVLSFIGSQWTIGEDMSQKKIDYLVDSQIFKKENVQ